MTRDQIVKALEKAAGVKNPQLEFPENEAFGDYSSNLAMQIAQKGERGDFLENIEWILTNVNEKNWKIKKFNLPVGRLNSEVVKAIKAKSDLVFLNGFIYAKINGWLGHRVGHKEVLDILRALPFIIFYPIEVYEDRGNELRNLFAFDLGKFGVAVIEVLEKNDRNEIVTIFFVNPRRLKNGILGKYRIPSLQAPVKAAGASFSGLQESRLFYSKLGEKSQGLFSLDYEIKRNPRELAEEIIARLSTVDSLRSTVDKIDVAGPGFINFWLNKDVLIGSLNDIDIPKIGNGKTVVIDYSSPNIAKPFGIGHLRSTIIGQALYNLYKSLGYNAVGDNHLGDWGTQFGKLLFMIDKTKTDDFSIENLERLYVEFHEHIEWEDGGRAWFKKLEEGDIKAGRIWQKCVDVSMKEFERIYKILGVKIDFAFGESYYESEMKAMMNDSKIKKFISEGEEGAKVINLNGIPPLMFLKSDGATTYATRDLATIIFRVRKWSPDIIIYEVGAEQTLYFRQLFTASRLMGLAGDNVELVHTAHGLYFGSDGRKFSTRRGKTIKLEEVLNEAIERAKELGNRNEKTAMQVGIGAIKYFDLMHSVQSDVVFDWEKMMNLEGNSGPYLQYTVARCNSVLAKATFKGPTLQGVRGQVLQEEELAILRKLSQFQEVIVSAAKSYSPNILCNYLYDLASKFNTFYNKYRILATPSEESFRIKLTAAVGRTLKTGLTLLGIQAPEKM